MTGRRVLAIASFYDHINQFVCLRKTLGRRTLRACQSNQAIFLSRSEGHSGDYLPAMEALIGLWASSVAPVERACCGALVLSLVQEGAVHVLAFGQYQQMPQTSAGVEPAIDPGMMDTAKLKQYGFLGHG